MKGARTPSYGPSSWPNASRPRQSRLCRGARWSGIASICRLALTALS